MQFIERWSRILATEGLPPVTGRLWAWLLICEPPDQTVEDIAQAIGASRGAISGAVRMLEPSGLIVRTKRSGDRQRVLAHLCRTRWSTAWRPRSARRARRCRPWTRSSRPSPTGPTRRSARLREAQRLYAMLLDMFPALIAQFKAERSAQATAGVPIGKD